LAEHAGHKLDLDRMQPEVMLSAVIRSFEGDETPLSTLIIELVPLHGDFDRLKP
jgi:cell filamentation protein